MATASMLYVKATWIEWLISRIVLGYSDNFETVATLNSGQGFKNSGRKFIYTICVHGVLTLDGGDDMHSDDLSEFNVLVVDDEVGVLNSLRRLIGNNYNVRCCSDSREAYWALMENHYHVVISDMWMPHFTGFQLLQHVHKNSPASQKILLTGFDDPVATSVALNRGFVDYFVTKPWGNSELKEKVSAACERYRDLNMTESLILNSSQSEKCWLH